MIIEKSVCVTMISKDVGVIILEECAMPSSVKVTIGESRIYPDGFDLYGHPQFGKDKILSKALKVVMLDVEYEKMEITMDRDVFDSLEAIEEAMNKNCCCMLNEIVLNRKIYTCTSLDEDDVLNEFVINKRFYLNCYGEVGFLSEDFWHENEILVKQYAGISKSDMLLQYGGVDIIGSLYRNKKAFDMETVYEANEVCDVCNKAIRKDTFLGHLCLERRVQKWYADVAADRNIVYGK